MSLRVGSLFSGIGGLDLGLERAGMEVIWQVEKDEYARRVLRKHWPEVPCWPEVRYVHYYKRGERCPGCLEPVDLICGGFPCQDISVAGKGAGIKEGTRSGLWIEFARIVRELRPRYVLVENVSALRSRGLDRVLGDLAALGYDAEWDCVPACAVGAPHRRDRIFVVAYARGAGLEGLGASGAAGDGRSKGALANADGQRELQPSRRLFHERGRSSDGGGQWAVEPDVGRVAHGVPARVDRLRCLGNAVVPQVAEFIGRCILSHAGAL